MFELYRQSRFLRPINYNGDIGLTSGWENINSIVSLAQKHNVKTLISFGGGEFTITAAELFAFPPFPSPFCFDFTIDGGLGTAFPSTIL